jgi:hypothetical protein
MVQCVGGGGGVWGHRRGGGLRQMTHLPQSPGTSKFFLYITTFAIAFHQSNLSMAECKQSNCRRRHSIASPIISRRLQRGKICLYKNMPTYNGWMTGLVATAVFRVTLQIFHTEHKNI